MQDLTKSQPLVSVVIATYNMGQYLVQAVNSILQQTWKNIEIVVVDDGSTDQTPEAMAQYQNDSRVIYIRNENQGQPKAKNCGIKNTTGEFIAFCDADDLWESNKLEVQMPLFTSQQIGVVYSDISNIGENNERYEKIADEVRYVGKVTDQMLIKNFVPFGTAVIRRACIEKSGIFDEQFRMGIDWDLWLRYSLDWEFAYTPKRTYIYRVWSGQMSGNYRGRYDFAFRILQNFVTHHSTKLNPKQLKKAWGDMYISRALAFALNERTFVNPIKDVLKGLTYDPANITGWKLLIKLIVKRV